MGDGFRLFAILFGAGVTAGLVHRALRSAEASTMPRRPVEGPAPDGGRWFGHVDDVGGDDDGPPIRINENLPAITQWSSTIDDVMPGAGVPPEVGRAWLAIESGGNVCAVGSPTATGPDGYPREVGPFQHYNPDDLRALGSSAAELTAHCAIPPPGPRQKPDGDGGFKDGSERNPQHLATALAPALMRRHVELGAGLANLKRAAITPFLAANKIVWPPSSGDFWAAVKAMHAYPPIIKVGLGQVTRHLGRAPVSWREFRNTYKLVEPRARYNPALKENEQTAYCRGLRNAEWVGFHVRSAAR